MAGNSTKNKTNAKKYKKYWDSKQDYKRYKYNTSKPTKKERKLMDKGEMAGFRRKSKKSNK